MSELYVRNRHPTRQIPAARLRAIVRQLAAEWEVADFVLGVLLVGDAEMTELNKGFLRHAGTTDVLTFPEEAGERRSLNGEVFICLDEAVRQARRYRTSWESEVVRYLVHGLLHLQGYKDRTSAERSRMKVAENKLVRRWSGGRASAARASIARCSKVPQDSSSGHAR